MKNNNDSLQKQINSIYYQKYKDKEISKMENEVTQILINHIKTYDLGLITLAIINRCEVEEIPNERGVYLIQKNKNTEDLYQKYKNKETLVEPLVYSRTLLNLINNKDEKHKSKI